MLKIDVPLPSSKVIGTLADSSVFVKIGWVNCTVSGPTVSQL